DLKLIQGSGPGGRIVRRDVEAASTAPAAAAVAAAPALRPVAQPAAAGAEYEDLPLSPMRSAIARRMPLSKAPVPHFYVTSEVAMDRAWELREELNGLEDGLITPVLRDCQAKSLAQIAVDEIGRAHV